MLRLEHQDTHRGRVMEKMKAGSFADLVRMSATLGPASQPSNEGAARSAATMVAATPLV